MQQKRPHADEDDDNKLVERRIALADVYEALPEYGTGAFWGSIEEPDLKKAVPLEVLVKCVRVAIAKEDDKGRNRIIEVIIRRTQTSNEYWTYHALSHVQLSSDERSMLVGELYADLCERLIRALMDPKRSFWEEHFQHSLRFERKHVYQALMEREGRWMSKHEKRTERIPRVLIERLDQPVSNADGDIWEPMIEDERAQQELLAVEHSDLARLILHLPDKLKAILWLIFWEGRTEKDTARLLGISDRTVRNRLREGLGMLREMLEPEKGATYG